MWSFFYLFINIDFNFFDAYSILGELNELNFFCLLFLFFYELYYVTIFFWPNVGAPDWAACWSILFSREFTTFPTRRTIRVAMVLTSSFSCNPGIDIDYIDSWQVPIFLFLVNKLPSITWIKNESYDKDCSKFSICVQIFEFFQVFNFIWF